MCLNKASGTEMNSLASASAIGGAIVGIVTVMVVFAFAKKKRIRIGEGKRMGLNLASDLECPNCGAPFPATRIPKNFRQAMWGGWTCERCDEEFDKWLAPISKSK